MTEWQTLKMRDVMRGFYDGPHATPPTADAGPIFLGIKNITESGHLDLSSIRHIAEEHFEQWTRRVTPQADDIVFSYEATLHRYAIIPEGFRGCLGRRLALIRVKPEVALPRYLHFFLLGPTWRQTITDRVVSGSTVDRIPIVEFPDFPMSLPDLRTQRAVLEVLSTLDDLIENNRRRVELLEQMAQAIYREWFVHFRYPGHEDVPLVDSPLGPIPDGWEARPIGTIADVQGGSTVTKAAYVESGYRAFSASGPDGYLADFEVEGCGVVLSAVGARCGRTFRASSQWSAIANTIKILPRRSVCGPSWLYLATADPAAWPRRGSAQPFVSVNDVRRRELVLPNSRTRHDFEAVASGLYQAVDVEEAASRALECIRDVLLPKLVTGEIDVSELDLDALVEAPA